MSMVQLPWAVSERVVSENGDRDQVIKDAAGAIVCELHERPITAQFIADAVNAHDDLASKLDDMRRLMQHVVRILARDGINTLEGTAYTQTEREMIEDAAGETVASYRDGRKAKYRTWEQLTDGERFDIHHSENPPTIKQATQNLWKITDTGWICADRASLRPQEIADCS